MLDLTIRDAISEDLAQIVSIYNANVPSYLATADTEPISVASRIDWFSKHSPQQYPLWVVENADQKVIAWLGFQQFYGRPAYQKTAELSIYIDPNFQRQGIGKILLSKAIQESQNLNLKTLLGFIFAHNKPSLKLFTNYGFEQWGYLPQVAELEGIERDLIIMGRKIVRD
ncbi:MAG: GNAT family N-acetyltransferase [Snowella sp.]|nr:GNAT family N-acetyltransferase [Snowella sp.]